MRVAVFSIVVGALDNRAHAVSGLRAADAVSALARAFSGTATLTTPTPAPTPALLTTPSGYIMPYEQIVWDSMVAANATSAAGTAQNRRYRKYISFLASELCPPSSSARTKARMNSRQLSTE